MRKIKLLICFLAISNMLLAQSKIADIPREEYKQRINHMPINNPASGSLFAPVPFWTDDFSDPSLWETYDALNGGLMDWVITTSAPVGPFSAPMGAIASTTSANGFALYDSDAMNTNYNTPQDAVITYKGTVDCSAYQYVNINFESYHRKFHDSIFVEISTDSITWDRYEVDKGLGVTESSDNPQYVSINISASAGYQPAVYFRFHYEGEWDYAWMVDDVSFSETPDDALSFGSETFGGWWIGYEASGNEFGSDFTFYPLAQAQANPYRLEGVIENIGINAQTNVTMHASIDDMSGGVPTTLSSTPMTLNFGEGDTVAMTTTFTPTNMGYHQINFWASSDNVSTTDTAGRGTVVTDTIYGMDFDWNSDGANAGSGYFLGRECGGQVLGNAYDIYAPATVTSISFHVNSSSVVGSRLKAELYEVDPTTTVDVSPPVWFQESNDYVLTTADIDAWVTLPLKTPIQVTPGGTWLAAVHGEQGFVGDTTLISSNSNPNSVSYLQDNCGSGDWGGLSKAMLIRMNFGSSTASSIVDIEKNLSVYPNPSSGVFTIYLSGMNSQGNILSVTNILGQTIYHEIFDTHTSVSKKLDLSSLDKGVYILKIESSDVSVSRQLIIE